MLSLDPSDRPTFDTALTTHRATTFPEFFYSFLHQYNVSLNEIRSSPHVYRVPASVEMEETTSGREGYELLSDADERIEKISGDMETIKVYLDTEDGPKDDIERDTVPFGTSSQSRLACAPKLMLYFASCRRSSAPSPHSHHLQSPQLSSPVVDDARPGCDGRALPLPH